MQHSHRGQRTFTGYRNTLRLNHGPAQPLYVPGQASEEALRQQLRHWYLRGVDLHEYWLHDGQPGNRTLLLRPEPGYDEQLQLRRACGFSLYHRPQP